MIFDENHLIISTQVLREFINVMQRKLNQSADDIKQQVDHLIKSSHIINEDTDMICTGLELSRKYNYRFYDCLIISAALKAGCKSLLSEDMQHGHVINNSLTIINPFI